MSRLGISFYAATATFYFIVGAQRISYTQLYKISQKFALTAINLIDYYKRSTEQKKCSKTKIVSVNNDFSQVVVSL